MPELVGQLVHRVAQVQQVVDHRPHLLPADMRLRTSSPCKAAGSPLENATLARFFYFERRLHSDTNTPLCSRCPRRRPRHRGLPDARRQHDATDGHVHLRVLGKRGVALRQTWSRTRRGPVCSPRASLYPKRRTQGGRPQANGCLAYSVLTRHATLNDTTLDTLH
eukprot:6899163-Pyramimonas_sp.AAC.1